MDLINRYAHEVGQHLPHCLRADVEAELRSLLTDSVEERARLAGVPADEGLAAAVLREFGTPKDAAARYDAIIKVVLQWFLVFSAINACVLLYRLLRRRPAEPWIRA